MTERTRPSPNSGDAQREAGVELYDIIVDTIADIRDDKRFGLATHTAQIRDLAIAFRLVSGGPQPGSVEMGK
jgi:hypothetical protein